MEAQYGIKAQLHAHTSDSNGPNADSRRLLNDSPLPRNDLVDTAYRNGIQALFVTNHNTLDGYREMVDYARSKYDDRIKIYLGEEVSAEYAEGMKDTAHAGGLGMNEIVKRGMSVEETIDRLKDQAALVLAPHPFGCISSVGKRAMECDIIEGFNAGNLDIYSDIAACEFAKRNNKVLVAGGDAHIRSSVGRGTNIVYAENNLDSIIKNVKKGNLEVIDTTYNNLDELKQIVTFQFKDSKLFLDDIRNTRGPIKGPIVAGMVKMFISYYLRNTDNPLFDWMGSTLGHYTAKAQMKAHIYDYDGDGMILMKSPWGHRLKESLTGLDEKKFGKDIVDLSQYEGFLESSEARVRKINQINKELRGQLIKV